MKVTVVVRTYNRPEFLKEALASIHLQTHTDWEVLIFDDGATNMNFDAYRHDDDILAEDSLEYLSNLYNTNPD